MAQSAAARRAVYVPQDIHLQMPASKEHPGGRVVTLRQGYQELDDDVVDHPIVARLMGDTPGAAARNERIAEAERDYQEAVGEAQAKLAAVRADCLNEETEERNQMTAEWQERHDDAANRGMVHNEPHPDPATRRAQALTGQPNHVYAAAGLAQKPQSLEEAKKTRESLEDEDDVTRRSAERNAEQGRGRNGNTSRAAGKNEPTGNQKSDADKKD